MRTFLRSLPVFEGDLPGFQPDEAPDRPEDLFAEWLAAAVRAGVREPHAMTLSTIGTDGAPTARTLIVKNVDAGGWQFAAHANSPKGRSLAAHPVAAMTFYWSPQARQIRVRGPVVAEPADHGAADFLARGIGSRAEALAGCQSRPLDSRQSLDLSTKHALERLSREPDVVVPEWTVYTLRAKEVEFWQGDRERRHTRLRYRRTADLWHRDLLWP